MPAPLKLTGRRFGLLTVLRRTDQYEGSSIVWECKCDCGRTCLASAGNLSFGHKRSCGCLRAQAGEQNRNYRHGDTVGYADTPEYRTWCGMRDRCSNTKNQDFRRYGGRGIVVCERWKSFPSFLEDMGRRPPGMSIDRIDFDGPYSKENCRWATPSQQTRNMCTTIRVEYEGKTIALKDLSEQLGLSYTMLYQRIRRLKWPLEKALRVPWGKRS